MQYRLKCVYSFVSRLSTALENRIVFCEKEDFFISVWNVKSPMYLKLPSLLQLFWHLLTSSSFLPNFDQMCHQLHDLSRSFISDTCLAKFACILTHWKKKLTADYIMKLFYLVHNQFLVCWTGPKCYVNCTLQHCIFLFFKLHANISKRYFETLIFIFS